MDNPNITMEEYIRLEEEKAHRRAIVFNDTLTSEETLSCEPTVSSLNNEIDFRVSFDESDDEVYTGREGVEAKLDRLSKVEEDGEVRVVTRVVYNLVAKLDDGGARVLAR
ncbi:hypothetical protein Tco_0537375 [Tanacetum coccineum]